jgi:hypothetical protein
VLLLDRAGTTKERTALQRSIEKVVSKGQYEWVTISIDGDGQVHEKD